ncbi:MAG: class I SAM-dependent methyltransferase [Gammaproteobacteria bacterium]|nr:class I SAM-dependent methyltransferase [Gammaproteobacteria bacterium]
MAFHKNDQQYHQCSHCQAIFMDRSDRLNINDEKLRYLDHNNDVADQGYQQFVSPITSAILQFHTPAQRGLDFGAGTGPVIAKILADNNFNVVLYDPFFHNDRIVLNTQYDFIICCEVMEHFYQPDKEFALLKRLLKPNGRLYCMTDLYHQDIDFSNWYYQRDNTHVFFYHQKSLKYIKQQYGFSDIDVSDRLIIYAH